MKKKTVSEILAELGYHDDGDGHKHSFTYDQLKVMTGAILMARKSPEKNPEKRAASVTDEEINAAMLNREYDEMDIDTAWIKGAKWMRDKLKK